MIKRILNSLVQKASDAYWHHGRVWYAIPFYCSFFGYELGIYAMRPDWASLRIKIEKNCRIVFVIKKGLY